MTTTETTEAHGYKRWAEIDIDDWLLGKDGKWSKVKDAETLREVSDRKPGRYRIVLRDGTVYEVEPDIMDKMPIRVGPWHQWPYERPRQQPRVHISYTLACGCNKGKDEYRNLPTTAFMTIDAGTYMNCPKHGKQFITRLTQFLVREGEYQ